MLKKLVMTAVALSMSASLYAGINFDNPKANNFKEEISGVELVAPAPASPEIVTADKAKEWTIMVFVKDRKRHV